MLYKDLGEIRESRVKKDLQDLQDLQVRLDHKVKMVISDPKVIEVILDRKDLQ